MAAAFDVPVIRLRLQARHFYHLDTCFCLLDENTSLIHPPSFDEEGLALIHALFDDVVVCPEEEALHGLACNAAAFAGRHVVIDEVNVVTQQLLRERGWNVHSVATSEFRKSGGSVYCMKSYLFDHP